METITGAMAIIGFVNGFDLLLRGEYRSFGKFAIGIIAGIVLGYLGFFGIKGVEAGLGMGLAGSGLYKMGQQFNTIRQA